MNPWPINIVSEWLFGSGCLGNEYIVSVYTTSSVIAMIANATSDLLLMVSTILERPQGHCLSWSFLVLLPSAPNGWFSFCCSSCSTKPINSKYILNPCLTCVGWPLFFTILWCLKLVNQHDNLLSCSFSVAMGTLYKPILLPQFHIWIIPYGIWNFERCPLDSHALVYILFIIFFLCEWEGPWYAIGHHTMTMLKHFIFWLWRYQYAPYWTEHLSEWPVSKETQEI